MHLINQIVVYLSKFLSFLQYVKGAMTVRKVDKCDNQHNIWVFWSSNFFTFMLSVFMLNGIMLTIMAPFAVLLEG
jgi:hypothetical protein